MYIYRKEMNPPWSIKYRGLAYHYTKLVSFLDLVQYIYIYKRQIDPPVY